MDKDFYTLDKLIHDHSFINWVNQSDPSDVHLWNEWLEQHPEKRQLMEDAAMLVRGIPFSRRRLPENEIAESWFALQDKINREAVRRGRSGTRKYQMAAVVALMLASVFTYWFFYHEQKVHYITQYGEVRHIVLPDSSIVTLNANSALSFRPSSIAGSERKVFLEGEAFFSVVKKHEVDPVKFLVVTENAEVEVLGTQFNVNSRRGKTSVVLNTGKVKFNTSEDENAILKPGERVEYSPQHDLKLEKVDPELYSSWRKRKLKFDDTSLLELAQILEDNYGLKVIIENKSLQEKKITGEISAQNADKILKAVSKLFKIKISRFGNTVYFS